MDIFFSIPMLLILLVGGFAMYKFPTARKIGIVLLGLGLLIGGIIMFIYASSIASYDILHPDFGIRDNLSTGGLVLGFAGIIVLVAYFVVQSLKKSQK